MNKNKVAQCQGLFLIIDHGNVKGLRHWTDELKRRGMPAVIQTNEQMLTEHGDMIRNLSARGFEICGAYNEKPFWNEPYRFQQGVMRHIKKGLKPVPVNPCVSLGQNIPLTMKRR